MASAVVLEGHAASLTASNASAVLGQPLDFAVQVRLQPGETLDPNCVSAEVTLGDRRVPPSQVRAVVVATGSESARIRVLTEQAVDEPVVGVLLNAGCAAARYTRRYVVLADPPIEVSPPAALTAVAPVPPQALAPAQAMAAAPGLATATSTSTAAPGAFPPAAPAADSPAPAAAQPQPETAEARQAREAQEARRIAQAERRAQRRAQRRAERRAEQLARRQAAAAEAAAPRLRLEPVEPTPASTAAATGVEQALQAVADAASAARAAASAASAAAARIATLERTVTELRSEADAGREIATDLRARLNRAEQSSRWTTPLLALVLLLTALAAWMAWRLNAADRARQRGWQASSGTGPAAPNSELTASRQPTSPIPFVNSEIRLPQAAPARARPAWPAPVSLAPDTEPPTQPPPLAGTGGRHEPMAATQPLPRADAEAPMQRTDLLPPRGLIDEAAPRDVSIEELIDLEQQAEFFVVLGQDDAAIELLVEHLRHTGGGSPLPYLKLLEIYRRRGRRAEYERLRERFNQRFNAYAPEWEADLQAGRTLDTYAGVIPRLQQVWPRPLDAMAELEALLFRKSRGDLFELPAYREVLFLYSMARDLLDREAADSGEVDLLLPISDGSEFGSTSPAPYMALEGESGTPAPEGRPTAPLDFDLSADSGRTTSIFGPLDAPPNPARR